MDSKGLDEDDFIFKAIADYTYDWESWIDPDGAIRWVNPAVERITGYAVAECLDRPDYPLFLVHADDRMRVSDALEHARRHVSGNDLEFRIAHKHGSLRWGAISWQDLFDRAGRYRGFRTSVRDITDRKVHEVELLSSRDEAYRASRAKSEFLATMSHEIRTPIQNILGCAQLLAQTALGPNQEPLLKVMSDQGELLLRIVDDVLDFTALQSAQLRMERRPLYLLREIQLVVDAARGVAEAKQLPLTLHSALAQDALVFGDSHRLRQVLSNLVNNALKFTERGSVQIAVAEESPRAEDAHGIRRIRIEVRDSGIGIAEEDQATLFEPFHQIDPSVSRRFGGSGLGLSICKRLIQLMNGTLQVQSVPGVGSTFAISLPLEPAQQTEQPRESRTTPTPVDPSVPLCILVVEDTQVAREVIVALLESLGQHPDAVATGAQALQAMKNKTYHLVLMDKHMSGMDGLTLTRLIRADASLSQPYIVAVTANVLQEARDACMAAGMDAFLGKPLRLADLQHLMKKVQTRVNLRTRLGPAASSFDLEVLEELESVKSGNQSLLQKQAGTILSELKAATLHLAQLDPAADPKATQRWAHALRGSLRTIGAKEAAQLTEVLDATTIAALRQAVLRAHDAIARLVTPA